MIPSSAADLELLYLHKTACHGCGEYARDEDGDGFCEVQVNTIEGFWSVAAQLSLRADVCEAVRKAA